MAQSLLGLAKSLPLSASATSEATSVSFCGDILALAQEFYSQNLMFIPALATLEEILDDEMLHRLAEDTAGLAL